MADITYRWIDGPTASEDDWNEIESILAARGWSALNRQTSRILVAEDGEELAGMLVLQLFPHTEPLYVAEGYRATGIAETMADKMVEFLTDIGARAWEVMADSPHAAKLCESRGMLKVKSPVYRTGVLSRRDVN